MFSLPETQQKFSVHNTPRKFENPRITGHFKIEFEETLAGKSHDCRFVNVLETELRFQNATLRTRTQSLRFQIPLVGRVFSKSSVFVTD